MPALTSDVSLESPAESSCIRRWLLPSATAAYAAVLLWSTHAPRVPQPEVHLGRIPPDKLLHFFAYAVLGMLAAMTASARYTIRMRVLLALFATLGIFALADEVTQPLFGRVAEALDWVADVAGIAVALALWPVWWQVAIRLRKAAQ